MSRYTAFIKAAISLAVLFLSCGGGGVVGTTAPTNTPTINPTPTFTPSGPPVTSTVTILDAIGTTTLPDGSIGLVRFTSDYHDWSISVPVPSSVAGATLIGLQLIITTGNDDLKDGNGTNAIIQFASIGDVTFVNIEQYQYFRNGDTNTVTLTPLPPTVKVGSIQTLTIHTALPGGLNGDNWDVNHVKLVATIQQ